MDFSGKTIVVTGAASGMGHATAAYLTELGAAVVALDRAPMTAPAAARIQMDLSDAASIRAAVQQVPASLDAICNIAGLTANATPRTILAVNFVGTRRFTDALIDRVGSSGAVVSVASSASRQWRGNIRQAAALTALDDFTQIDGFLAEQAIPDHLVYKLSKEAVVLWTMQQARDRLGTGIRFNSISPGMTDTPMIRKALADGIERVVEVSKLARVMDPIELGRVVAFLCSDLSSGINGTDIPVDTTLSAALNRAEFGF